MAWQDYYPIGYASPTTYYDWTGNNFENQVASRITFDVPVTITEIGIHGSGYGSVAYLFYCIWYDYGDKIYQTGTVTWSNSARYWSVVNGLNWQLEKGTYMIGFWCSPTYPRQWSDSGSGATYRKTSTGGVTGQQNLSSHSHPGTMCCYARAQKGYFSVFDGTTYHRGMVSVYNGSSWVQAKGVWVFNGTSWVTAK